MFVEHFKRGRDAGWHVTVHAGEAAGVESVWQALNLLGATRIGHAVRIGEDPLLVRHIRDNEIGLEANLTSNYQTSTIKKFEDHPLSGWLEEGLLATINTDDPGISNITLRHEYEVAAPAAGLNEAMVRVAQSNALKIAFISEREKENLRQKKLRKFI
jgi:adenosine deaminase